MGKNYTALIAIYKKTDAALFKECLNSVLKQTIPPFEIIIIKDGQITDECEHILNLYLKYKFIKLVSFAHNMGLAVALNTALTICRTKYVFRIDSDDFALPRRAKVQINFLENNPSVDVLSSFAIELDNDHKIKKYRRGPLSHQDIVSESKFRNPILHPTVMFKKSAILKVGGYPEVKFAQDYALWCILIMHNFKFACLPQYLTLINQDNSYYKRRGFEYFRSERKVLKYLRGKRFLNYNQYTFQLFFRFFSRLCPFFARFLLYKFARFIFR